MPGWQPNGRMIQKSIIASGAAQAANPKGGRFQCDLLPGRYMLTVTEMEPIGRQFMNTPEGLVEVERANTDIGFKSPRQQEEVVGESFTKTLVVLDSGQATLEEFVWPEHPKPERMKALLDTMENSATGRKKVDVKVEETEISAEK